MSGALGLCVWAGTANRGAAQTLTATPSQLTFSMAADSTTLPPSQTLQVTSTSGSVPFTVNVVQYGAGGGPPLSPVYLSVSPSSGVTPATLTVNLLPSASSFGYGEYYNVIGIVVGQGGTPVFTYLFVNLPPPPVVSTIVNGASFQAGISPGSIVSIFGNYIGPGIPAGGYASSSPDNPDQVYYSAFIGNSKVTFNGYLAPLLYASAGQINAVVPYEVAGQTSLQMVVSHDLVSGPAMTVPLVDTSPGIFTVSGSGTGPGAILNQDNRLNSAINPAAAGSIIQIFAAGAGLWNQTEPDGLEISSSTTPLPLVAAPVSLTIGGAPANVVYAGAAPGLITGALQVNAVVPSELAPGPQPVVLTIGDHSNAGQNVTVAVK